MKGKIIAVILALILLFIISISYPIGCTKTIHSFEISIKSPTYYVVDGYKTRQFTTIIIENGSIATGKIENSTFIATIPSKYLSYAKNISYMLEDVDTGYQFTVASIYYNRSYPAPPTTDNYLLFSLYAKSIFSYSNAPLFMDPTELIIKHKGVCQNYAKLWAALLLDNSETPTIAFLVPYNKMPGHVFVIYNNMVIENNGKIYLNTLAAFNNWYSHLGPYSIVFLTLYPGKTKFSLSSSSFTKQVIHIIYPLKYTITVTRTFNNKITTYTVTKGAFNYPTVKMCKNIYTVKYSNGKYYYIRHVGPISFTPLVELKSPADFPFTSNKYDIIYIKPGFGKTTVYFAYIGNQILIVNSVTFGRNYNATFTTIMNGQYLIETQKGTLG